MTSYSLGGGGLLPSSKNVIATIFVVALLVGSVSLTLFVFDSAAETNESPLIELDCNDVKTTDDNVKENLGGNCSFDYDESLSEATLWLIDANVTASKLMMIHCNNEPDLLTIYVQGTNKITCANTSDEKMSYGIYCETNLQILGSGYAPSLSVGSGNVQTVSAVNDTETTAICSTKNLTINGVELACKTGTCAWGNAKAIHVDGTIDITDSDITATASYGAVTSVGLAVSQSDDITSNFSNSTMSLQGETGGIWIADTTHFTGIGMKDSNVIIKSTTAGKGFCNVPLPITGFIEAKKIIADGSDITEEGQIQSTYENVSITKAPKEGLLLSSTTTSAQVKEVLGATADWSVDADNNGTLTLGGGIDYTSDVGVAIKCDLSINKLTINVSGTNKISTSASEKDTMALYLNNGVTDDATVTIVGDGKDSSSLELCAASSTGDYSSSYGLYNSTGVPLSISNVTLKATSGDASDASVGLGFSDSGLMTISNSIVAATGGSSDNWSVGIGLGSDWTTEPDLIISDESTVIASGSMYGIYNGGEHNLMTMKISDSDVTMVGGDSATSDSFAVSGLVTCTQILAGNSISSLAPITEDPVLTTHKVVKIVGIGPVTTEHTITYKLNGGTGTAPGSDTVEDGSDYTIKSTDSTKSGYKFVGWTIEGDSSGKVYKVGDKIESVTSDITFVAVWEADPEPVPPTPTPTENKDMPIICLCLVVVVIIALVALAWCGRND